MYQVRQGGRRRAHAAVLLRQGRHRHRQRPQVGARAAGQAGMNCIKIGLPGKLILSKRKGLLCDASISPSTVRLPNTWQMVDH